MPSINLGRVGFVLRGTWSSGTAYNQLDVVTYNGAAYAARTASTGVTPSSGSSVWQELTGISAAVQSAMNNAAVRFDTAQTLTGAQQTMARTNIDAASTTALGSLQTTVADMRQTVMLNKGNIDNIYSYLYQVMQDVGDALLDEGTALAGDYSNLLSNVSKQGIYYISRSGVESGAGIFNDRPVDTDGSAAIMIVYPVSTTYVLQNLIDVHGGNYFRYIDISDNNSIYAPTALKADTNGWYMPKQVKTALESIQALQQNTQVLSSKIDTNTTEIQKALLYKGSARSDTYEQLLSNIAAPGMYYISRSGVSGAGEFEDRPVDSDGSAAILLAYPVLNTHILQNLIDVHGGNYFRYIVVSDKSVYAPSALNADTNGWYLPKQINTLTSAVSEIRSDLNSLAQDVTANTENLQKAFLYKGMVKSADYGQLLSNVNAQGVYYISQESTSSGAGVFNDRPIDSDGSAAILLAYPVSTSFVLQNLIDVHGSNFFRYIKVSDQSVYAPSALHADTNGWFIPKQIRGAVDDIAVLEARQRWAGKKIVFFGDSRTWYDGQTYANDNTIKTDWRGETCVGYQQQCVNLLGITAVNEGVSGDTSAQICTRIRQYDFSDCDAVFLEGGVNDYIRRVAENVQIGEIAPIGGDTETYPDTGFNTGTVYGAWQSAIEYICKNYPQVKIFMDIPAIAWNANGVFPYSTASIKGEIAELYNIPCLNLYKEAGINELNRDYYYVDNPDYGTRQWRLHFNNYGNAHVGQIIAEFINTH